jgi:small subunit ribosomal protein S14
MAKKSILAREKKKVLLNTKFLSKRDFLIKQLKNNFNFNEILLINKKIQKIALNSAHCRLHNRCSQTGKPRGYSRFFGLCRNFLRKLALEGFLPGAVKKNW